MSLVNKFVVVIIALLGLTVLGFTPIPSAHAEAQGEYKLIYEKLCGTDISCHVFNYCTGCHNGLVVGTTVIAKGKMTPLPGNYDEWVGRLQRMSAIGCHIPSVLIPKMAAYLDNLDDAQLPAKAKAAVAAKAKEAIKNPGKSNVERYCVGCHDGLVVGTTVIGGGLIKSAGVRNYDEWVGVVKKMSERRNNNGAHIPTDLIPDMATYLAELDKRGKKAPTTR